MHKVPANFETTGPPTTGPNPTRTPLRRKLWLAAPMAAVLTIGFTGSALARQGADDRIGGSTITSVDVSGPCDEAEHVNDPRCAGAAMALTGPTTSTGSTSTTSTTSGAAQSNSVSTGSTSSTGVDISGPCDEAEHANDPRCAGISVTRSSTSSTLTTGVDISGPCDEVEHVNDPRCTGTSINDRSGSDDDSSGQGRGRGRGRGGDADSGSDSSSGSGSGSDSDSDSDHS